MKLSIIIPVYNEIETIEEVIRNVLDCGYEKELIIVDDGSNDGTREFLEDNIKDSGSIRVCYHDVNRGKTAAIRTALKYISGDVVIIQDADMEYNPSDYKRLLRPIIYKKADVVYGSRFFRINRYLFAWHWFASSLFKRPYQIKYLSHFMGIQFLNFMAFLLYGVRLTDIATGYKVFKSEVIRKIRLDANRFEFCYEITAKLAKRNVKIKEVHINYHPRSNLRGKKITWRDGVWAALALIKCRFR